MSEPKLSIPRHVAVIMDGNGRWAKDRGLPRVEGHREGAKTVQRVIDGCIETGVEFLTLYAFSVENWKRPQLEVSALMRLLIEFLRARHDEMLEKNIRLRVIGRVSDLPPKTLAQVEKSIAATAQNTGLTLILALSYGSRTEILEAVNKLISSQATAPVTEEQFSRALYTADYPDPDLLIRTSGEMRLSNFLLWQMSYAEIYVTKKRWPEFSREDFLDAVRDFAQRERRYGGI
ncbi:MAG TPA: isoprenyl transferase [Chthoniobacterales bacterium]|jgi:undecaprenyl diphosphate synthase